MKQANREDLQRTRHKASMWTGGALALAGLRRRGLSGALLGIGGAVLLYRSARDRALPKRIDATGAVTIGCSISEAYSFFRDLKSLKGVFPNLEQMERTEDGYRWTLRSGRKQLRFETTFITEEPDRKLEWIALPGGDLEARGSFRFRPAPGDRGTEVVARLQYWPAGMLPPEALAPLFRKLGRAQISRALGRVKQTLETGEIATNQMRPERRIERRAEEQIPEARAPELGQAGREATR